MERREHDTISYVLFFALYKAFFSIVSTLRGKKKSFPLLHFLFCFAALC